MEFPRPRFKYPSAEFPLSAAIKSIRIANKYDILVEFTNNKLYLFYNSARLFKQWKAAPSKGRFFHAKVKDRFRYSKVIADIQF